MDDTPQRRLPHLGELVEQKALSLGQAGERWLAELPDLIRFLERAWSITVGESLSGGSAAYVAHARTARGEDAVLKLALPEPEAEEQIHTIASADGRGYMRLFAYDLARRATLQERLGSPMAQLPLAPERMIELLCQTLIQAWQAPRRAEQTMTPEREKAAWLGRSVSRMWEQLGRPCSERVIAQALRYAANRAAAFALARCVVVHGDPHPWNALQVAEPRAGAESGFVFVDPDGFLAEPAYDLGVVLRDWSHQLLAGDARTLAHSYCALLSAQTGIDETAIWEWGYLERVSTGLYATELGAADLGRPFLDVAEMLV